MLSESSFYFDLADLIHDVLALVGAKKHNVLAAEYFNKFVFRDNSKIRLTWVSRMNTYDTIINVIDGYPELVIGLNKMITKMMNDLQPFIATLPSEPYRESIDSAYYFAHPYMEYMYKLMRYSFIIEKWLNEVEEDETISAESTRQLEL